MEARFSEPDLGHLVRRIFDMNGRLRSGASVVANARRPQVPVSCLLPEGVRQKVNNALGRMGMSGRRL